jgi:hypothetical protein
MTRSAGEVRRAREIFERGISISEAARLSGIPRTTLRGWIRNGFTEPRLTKPLEEPCDPCPAVLNLEETAYAYLLGLYLGDGCISKYPRTYKLRITLDQKYPNIIAECKTAMAALLPNRVGQVQRVGCVEITSHSQHWPCLFPQHGLGPKHRRSILLTPWQAWVAIERHPRLLLRGLIHSDGCRYINRIRGRYEYPSYSFSNRSPDIRAIFMKTCDRLGIKYRQPYEWTICIAKRADVAILDTFIGPKY